MYAKRSLYYLSNSTSNFRKTQSNSFGFIVIDFKSKRGTAETIVRNDTLIVNNGIIIVDNDTPIVNNGVLIASNDTPIVNNGVLIASNGTIIAKNGILIVHPERIEKFGSRRFGLQQ